MERRCIGRVMVDSGQLFLIDPAYLSGWTHGDYFANVVPDNSYARVTTAMFDHGGFAEVEHGVVFSADGDGYYPVYVTLDDHGYVVKVEILLQTDDPDGEPEELTA